MGKVTTLPTFAHVHMCQRLAGSDLALIAVKTVWGIIQKKRSKPSKPC